jgi:hypothetical protein
LHLIDSECISLGAVQVRRQRNPAHTIRALTESFRHTRTLNGIAEPRICSRNEVHSSVICRHSLEFLMSGHAIDVFPTQDQSRAFAEDTQHLFPTAMSPFLDPRILADLLFLARIEPRVCALPSGAQFSFGKRYFFHTTDHWARASSESHRDDNWILYFIPGCMAIGCSWVFPTRRKHAIWSVLCSLARFVSKRKFPPHLAHPEPGDENVIWSFLHYPFYFSVYNWWQLLGEACFGLALAGGMSGIQKVGPRIRCRRSP